MIAWCRNREQAVLLSDRRIGKRKVTLLARTAVAIGLAACGIARGQNPDPPVGARLYRLHCSECHGPEGQGGQGPDLTRGVYRFGSTDEALYRTISKGIAGTPMPATAPSAA